MLPELEPLEVHSGVVVGHRRSPPPPPPPPLPGGPLAVLEALLVEALSHPPCYVLFSGGRDSSIILAAALGAARRHGLTEPVPVTAVHPNEPETAEEEWQRLTLEFLGLPESLHLTVHDELDFLGPLAVAALQRHGIFWPPMAVSLTHFAERLGTGTIVTGGGGDELFTPLEWRRRSLRELAELSSQRRAVKWAAWSALPPTVRQRLLSRRERMRLPWLRPTAEEELNAALRQPRVHSLAEEVELYLDSRYLECLRTVLDTFAAEAGVRLIEPFYDPRFVRAVAAHAPRTGWASRTEALRVLFADLLPPQAIGRTSKATFTRSSWGPAARRFAADWDGTGLDEDLVDPIRLKAAWHTPIPDARSVSPLHLAFLRAHQD